MSQLKPDFEPLANSAFFFRPNTAIQADVETPENPATLQELQETLRKFSLNFTGDDLKKFKQAALTAKTCAHNRSSIHYWQLIKDFFMQSLKKTYPDKDLSVVNEAFNSINLSEIAKDHVDNLTFIVYLLGITSGLL